MDIDPDESGPLNPEAREVVQRSEQMLGVLFAGSPMAIGISRRDDGMLVDVNEEWARLTGYSREEAVGRTVTELGIWEDGAARERAWGRLRWIDPY